MSSELSHKMLELAKWISAHYISFGYNMTSESEAQNQDQKHQK